jgi:hypothetical protein
MTVEIKHENRWVSAATAGRILGVAANRVRRLAAESLLTVRKIPGCDPRYRLDDVERLANASTTPAAAELVPLQAD